MKLGNLEITEKAALAPLAGVADRAFRELCRGYGAAYTVCEMASAKGISLGDKKSAELLSITPTERPAGSQIFGNSPETMAIAANSVGYAIGIFSVLPGFAINLGLTAVISRCVGANDYEQVRFYNKKIILIVFISHIIINVAIFALLPFILDIYQLSDQTAAMASEMIIWHGIFAIIIWPIAFTLPATFRGAGDSKTVMYISLAVMFTCRIALSYVIADWLGIGVFGTWIAMFIDWYVRAALYVYRYFSNKWTEYRIV